jgi:hypothetical protein
MLPAAWTLFEKPTASPLPACIQKTVSLTGLCLMQSSLALRCLPLLHLVMLISCCDVL